MTPERRPDNLHSLSRRGCRITRTSLGWGVVVLISVAAAFYYPAFYYRRWVIDRSCRQVEYYHMVMCCDLSRYIYEQTGMVVSDLATLYSTAFYPFRQPVGGCDKVQRRLQVVQRTGVIEWQGMWQFGNKVFMGDGYEVRLKSALLPEGERTKRLLRAYSRGSLWWQRVVAASHERERARIKSILRLHARCCADNLTLENDLPSLAFDLPRDEQELREYVEWLHRVLGSGLVDEWQRAVRIRWERARIIFRSAGSDGVFGNRDDILLVVASADGRFAR